MLTSTILSLITRVIIALSTRTIFQPDEFFQSLEPAHHLVFGFGHLTWEWLTQRPIRSIVYPGLNIPIYWLLKISGLDRYGTLVITAPKILHGIFAAGTDIGLCELTRVVLGKDYVSTALFLSVTCFFNALALSRSLSNSLETSLSSLAFAYYPWDASSRLSPQVMFNRSRLRKALLFSALACMIRPTSAALWVFLYGKLLWSLRYHKKLSFNFLRDTVAIGAATLLVLFIIDSLYYRKPTLTALNFLVTNFSSVSLFYGTSPWHYYITQGLPILCTTALPFTVLGLYTTLRSSKTHRRSQALETMFATITWTILLYSLAGHKEWRFIHPILPLLHIFAAKALVDANALSSRSVKQSNSKASKSSGKPQPPSVLPSVPICMTHFVFLLSALPLSLYVVFMYCSAPISVLAYLRSLPVWRGDDSRNFTDTVGFLMPCHSTPTHAYIHCEELAKVPGRMWALGCEPPLGIKNISSYQDQTDVFFSSPKAYLQEYFPSIVNPVFPPSPYPSSLPGESGRVTWLHEWPKHLIMFGHLLKEDLGVRELLREKGYQQVWEGGREWEGEGKRTGGVRVWRWQS